MENQNYENHTRWVPMYHFVAGILVLALVIAAVVEFTRALMSGQGIYEAAEFFGVVITLITVYWYARVFALRAQDRAIRAEENLRHFVLTGKLLDPIIRMGQVIGLRFASDGEFVALAQKAVADNMSQTDIKKAIKNWRGDFHRA